MSKQVWGKNTGTYGSGVLVIGHDDGVVDAYEQMILFECSLKSDSKRVGLG
jgi:hypothetical protein